MRRTDRAFIPCTLLLVLQIAACVVIDKILLDKLAIAEVADFREQYGGLATILMGASLLLIFCSVSIFFERSMIKYIFMLVMSIIYTAIGFSMSNIIYILPIVFGILSFIAFLIADHIAAKWKSEMHQVEQI